MPVQEVFPEDIDSDLSSEKSYLAKRLPISLLLDQEFIQGFLKGGSHLHITCCCIVCAFCDDEQVKQRVATDYLL